jgi:sugar lactone lactonase YvrE
MTVRRLVPALLLAGAILAPVPGTAQAAGTQYWTLRTAADHAQAELEGVALGPDGALAAGPEIESLPLPGDAVTWAMLVEPERTLLAVGPGGRVLTVRGSRVTTDSTGEGVALSLARGPDGALYAGTGPAGRIVRLDDRGRRTYFDSGQKYVWALAWVGRTLYAATGPGGKLFAIDGEGRGRVVLDAKAAHLTALAPDGRGGVFVGAAGRGIVYHVDGGGATRALYEAPEKEIKALAWDGRALFVAALSAAPLSFAANEAPEPGDGTGQRAVVYRIVPDSMAALHWVAPQGLVFALAPGADGTLWAATGSRAALYAIDPRGRGTALWSEAAGQATALARSGDGFLVATSSPSRLLRVRPRGAAGIARSAVLDARKVARWGRLWSEGEQGGATARARTRSGNTAEPDSTWSPWREVGGDGAVASPPARYLQWELRLSGEARVRAVTVAWGEVNQAPRIEDFIVYPVPGRFYEGELNVRREPVTQELPDGRRVQFNAEVPRRGSADALPPWAQGIRPMSWKAADPNGDALRYRLAVRREGESAWTPIADDLTNALYAWDTTGWPDGSYAVRLTASDEDENAAGSGLDDSLVASPVELDRTPPEISGLDTRVDGDVITVRGTGRDARTFVARVDVALDDGSWSTAAPDDGLWDGGRESFTIRLEGVARGEHLVRVRVTDALGNPATATRPVTIGR